MSRVYGFAGLDSAESGQVVEGLLPFQVAVLESRPATPAPTRSSLTRRSRIVTPEEWATVGQPVPAAARPDGPSRPLPHQGRGIARRRRRPCRRSTRLVRTAL